MRSQVNRRPPAFRLWVKTEMALVHARRLPSAIYLRELFIEVNLVLSFAPSPFTTEIIASEMPAAIRPYSIAVAPVSSRKNLEIICIAYQPVRFHQKVLLDETRDSLAAGCDVVQFAEQALSFAVNGLELYANRCFAFTDPAVYCNDCGPAHNTFARCQASEGQGESDAEHFS